MAEVRIAELKAKLSAYVRAAQGGARITVLDRNTPVAQLVPLDKKPGLTIRPPVHRGASLWRLPPAPPVDTKVDIVELLLEDRRKR